MGQLTRAEAARRLQAQLRDSRHALCALERSNSLRRDHYRLDHRAGGAGPDGRTEGGCGRLQPLARGHPARTRQHAPLLPSRPGRCEGDQGARQGARRQHPLQHAALLRATPNADREPGRSGARRRSPPEARRHAALFRRQALHVRRARVREQHHDLQPGGRGLQQGRKGQSRRLPGALQRRRGGTPPKTGAKTSSSHKANKKKQK